MEEPLGNGEEKLKEDKEEDKQPLGKDEEKLNVNDNSNDNETQKKGFQLAFWQKLVIIGVILVVWFTIVIIELVITFGSDDEITCIYTITDKGNNYILGKEFILNSISKIIVDDNKEITSFTNEYNFDKVGNHTVKFVLNGDLNMDNMFKDISNLVSIKMNSKKNAKITSMKSTFENCNSLNEFNIEGFDTKEI